MLKPELKEKKIKYIFELDKKLTYTQNNIMIKSVNNKKDFKDFYEIPWIIYDGDKNWVPPLWGEINRFFDNRNYFWNHTDLKLYVAIKNGKKVGRIAGFIDNKYCESKDERIGFFGFFECVNDVEISALLFRSVENWLKKNNVKKMIGPIDGRVDIGCGLVYEGFNHPPIFPDKYSLNYYINLVEESGMKKSRDFFNYYIDLKNPIPKDLEIAANNCENEYNVNIRFFNRKRAKKEIEWWSNFMIKTFTDHWGYVPVKTDEIKERYGIKNIRWFVDNKLFLIAEKDNTPIGFSWTFPDYNQIFRNMNGKFNLIKYLKFYYDARLINQANMNIIGIEKEYQNHGIASLLNFTTITELKKRGYKGAEIGVVDENNLASQKIIEKTGAKPHKTYRIYQKNINI
ncbi:MAG: GNAT family N-acetyltransferase [Candidatus Thermoplasmatota archaeon]|nr:GNAT family N-acetyltransferase [Candidatus Thermoplasmatota archaeon]